MKIISDIAPSDYEKKIPKLLWHIYRVTPLLSSVVEDGIGIYNTVGQQSETVFELSHFQDVNLAITVIKNWLDRGGLYLAHFNGDYSKFTIFKDERTELFIEKAKESNKSKEAA